MLMTLGLPADPLTPTTVSSVATIGALVKGVFVISLSAGVTSAGFWLSDAGSVTVPALGVVAEAEALFCTFAAVKSAAVNV